MCLVLDVSVSAELRDALGEVLAGHGRDAHGVRSGVLERVDVFEWQLGRIIAGANATPREHVNRLFGRYVHASQIVVNVVDCFGSDRPVSPRRSLHEHLSRVESSVQGPGRNLRVLRRKGTIVRRDKNSFSIVSRYFLLEFAHDVYIS